MAASKYILHAGVHSGLLFRRPCARDVQIHYISASYHNTCCTCCTGSGRSWNLAADDIMAGFRRGGERGVGRADIAYYLFPSNPEHVMSISYLVHSVWFGALLRGCEEGVGGSALTGVGNHQATAALRQSLLTAREAHPGCIHKPCRGLCIHTASTQHPHKAWHGPSLTCSCTPADTHNPTPLPLAPPHAPSQSVPVSQIRMAREQQDEPDEDRKNEHPKEYPGVKTSLLYQLSSYKIKLQ